MWIGQLGADAEVGAGRATDLLGVSPGVPQDFLAGLGV
jgi:hypothetical protein